MIDELNAAEELSPAEEVAVAKDLIRLARSMLEAVQEVQELANRIVDDKRYWEAREVLERVVRAETLEVAQAAAWEHLEEYRFTV